MFGIHYLGLGHNIQYIAFAVISNPSFQRNQATLLISAPVFSCSLEEKTDDGNIVLPTVLHSTDLPSATGGQRKIVRLFYKRLTLFFCILYKVIPCHSYPKILDLQLLK